MQNKLSGQGIVVTRPAQQAAPLAELIRNSGGTPILFPLLEIRDTNDQDYLLSVIARLGEFDMAVFVSPNAINRIMPLINDKGGVPAKLKMVAVGPSSVRELKRFGVTEVISPQRRFDSETLLGMPQLQRVTDKRVVIFRGDGGRELLGDTLMQRGAEIEYVSCYHRGKPDTDTAILRELWEQKKLHGLIVTSSEGMHNLVDMAGGLDPWLEQSPIFVSHARIRETASGLGLHNIILTRQGDEDLLTDLIKWFDAKHD